VLADTSTAAVSAYTSNSLVLADLAAAAFSTHTAHSSMFADAATAAVYTNTTHSLMLADATATAGFTTAPLPLMFAEAATALHFLLHTLLYTLCVIDFGAGGDCFPIRCSCRRGNLHISRCLVEHVMRQGNKVQRHQH